MQTLCTARRKLNLLPLLAAATLSLVGTTAARGAALVIDELNGVWGVAYSLEDRQIDRAAERAVSFGARANRLTMTTTTASRGYYVSYATGYLSSTKRWIGVFGFDAKPEVAAARALSAVQAQGAVSASVVRSWFDR